MRQSALWATTRAYLRSPSASRFTAPMCCEYCTFCTAYCLLLSIWHTLVWAVTKTCVLIHKTATCLVQPCNRWARTVQALCAK